MERTIIRTCLRYTNFYSFTSLSIFTSSHFRSVLCLCSFYEDNKRQDESHETYHNFSPVYSNTSNTYDNYSPKFLEEHDVYSERTTDSFYIRVSVQHHDNVVQHNFDHNRCIHYFNLTSQNHFYFLVDIVHIFTRHSKNYFQFDHYCIQTRRHHSYSDFSSHHTMKRWDLSNLECSSSSVDKYRTSSFFHQQCEVSHCS